MEFFQFCHSIIYFYAIFCSIIIIFLLLKLGQKLDCGGWYSSSDTFHQLQMGTITQK